MVVEPHFGILLWKNKDGFCGGLNEDIGICEGALF